MKKIPATTNEKALSYGASSHSCHCDDFERRGGSYRDPLNNDKVCKHIHHVRSIVKKDITSMIETIAPTPPIRKADYPAPTWSKDAWAYDNLKDEMDLEDLDIEDIGFQKPKPTYIYNWRQDQWDLKQA